jgi:oligopeptide/dipeptide ABC transporter ATP-binding protein
MKDLLNVENLTISYRTRDHLVTALRDVSLTLAPGEILGIVGESGCGKSTFSSVIGQLLGPTGVVESGHITFGGKDVLSLSGRELRSYRANDIAYVFQDPMNTLDPTRTIGAQFRRLISSSAWRQKAIEALAHVGLTDWRRVLPSYPHQLSGGMAQLAVIAMALIRKPRLLIADEPTAALDASIRGSVMDLLTAWCAEIGAAMIIISHDIPVISRYCDRIGVMYAGRFVEIATTGDFIAGPRHPYAMALLESEPGHEGEDGVLQSLKGAPPLSISREPSCAFADRCTYRTAICSNGFPPMVTSGSARVACVRIGDIHGEAVS